MAVKITGQREIAKNLVKANKQLARALRGGLISGMTYVERESNKKAPRDTGFLRISSFTTDVTKRGKVQIGRVGYDSAYAPFVHEMPESNNYTTPGTGPKFLEKAIKNNVREIITRIFRTTTRLLSSWQ